MVTHHFGGDAQHGAARYRADGRQREAQLYHETYTSTPDEHHKLIQTTLATFCFI